MVWKSIRMLARGQCDADLEPVVAVGPGRPARRWSEAKHVRIADHRPTMPAQACCRVCGRASARVQGRYWRTFDDLPWQDRSVTWRVQVRRFRCGHCPGADLCLTRAGWVRARRAAATGWPRRRPPSAWCWVVRPAQGCRSGWPCRSAATPSGARSIVAGPYRHRRRG